MLIHLTPSDPRFLGVHRKDAPPSFQIGPISVHGMFGREERDLLSSSTERHCSAILIECDFDGLGSDTYLELGASNAAENYAHVISWFVSASFGFRIDSMRVIRGNPKPFQFGIDTPGVFARSYEKGIGNKASSASCVTCSVASIGTLAHALLLRKAWEKDEMRFLERACMFYAEAQRTSLWEKNVAYALLISSLECLASTKIYSSAATMNDDDAHLLDRIRLTPEFGEAAYNQLKSRFFQLKRKCVLVVRDYLREDVYKVVGAQDGKLNNRHIAASKRDLGIAASYDIRSAFMHAGADHSFVTSDWWKTDFANVRSMLSQKLSKSSIRQSLNIYQLDGVVQHCLSSAVSRILLNDAFLPTASELASVSRKRLEGHPAVDQHLRNLKNREELRSQPVHLKTKDSESCPPSDVEP